MRKLAMAVAVAAAALTWAQVVRAEDAAQKRQEAASATKSEMKQDAQKGAQQSRDTMREGAAKTESKMHEARAGMAEKKSRFEGKDNFDVKGKLSKVSQDSVTITREDLPAATLKISQDTKIEVGGEKASTGQLKQGEDVKATFNLDGDKPVAVEIKAEKPKGAGQQREPAQKTNR